MSEPTPPALFKQREPTAILIIDIWCNLFEHIYLFLVCKLETHFVNVELDIGTVLDGEVQEEIVANSIDIVQTNDHP